MTSKDMRDMIDSVDGGMRDPKKRQAQLKAEIEAGYMPTVYNVSSTVEPVYTMGDVEALGWMTKDYYSDGDDVSWARYYHHDAPAPIKVKSGQTTEIWQPGHQEERY